MNKKLVFCSFLALFQIFGSLKAEAVDFIRAEDEDILWDTDAQSEPTLQAVLTEATDTNYDEYGRMRVRVQQKGPSLGVPLHAVKVPDEINARAPLYDNPELVKANAYRAQPVEYSSYNKDNARESSRGPIDPELLMNGYTPEMVGSHQDRVAFYENEIYKCLDTRKDLLSVEMGVLEEGSLYNNAAYLSQTFEDIELCYDNIGLDIIDEFYGADNDVLREYNQHSAEFHVSGVDAGLDVKYCGEYCSVKAIAELQLDKFSDYRVYLYNLLHDAPLKSPEVVCDKDPVPAPKAVARVERRPVHAARNPEKRAAPRTVRVRTPDGQIKYVRLNNDGEYELTDNEAEAQMAVTPQRTIRSAPKSDASGMQFDYDGVPLIDEDDL